MFSCMLWAQVCRTLGKVSWTPSAEVSLHAWCLDKIDAGLPTKMVRTFWVLIMWEIWKHRNAIVFDDAMPSMQVLVARIVSEGVVWRKASLLKWNWDRPLAELRSWARNE